MILESIFFETTKENIISKSNSISIQKNDRYPLMTRAHFSEALVAVALKFELASNVIIFMLSSYYFYILINAPS